MSTAIEQGISAMAFGTTGARQPAEAVGAPTRRLPFRVVIAGVGAAGAEAALRLHRLAAGRIGTTIVAPERDFVRFPPPVLSPFASGAERRIALPTLASLADADLDCDTLVSVDPGSRLAVLRDGRTLEYDALLIAVGAVAHPPFPRALTFGLRGSEEAMHGLIRDVEEGYVKRIAFVVPSGASWPLPIYELALATAERAFDMCVDVELTLVTAEAAPLDAFGAGVSRHVAQLLSSAGVQLKTRADPRMPLCGVLELGCGEQLADLDRVVASPVLRGPAIPGLPHDACGFLPVDAHGRVQGADGVYAAGDATAFAIKQGWIACQQADAAAEAIAARAGTKIDPAPFTAAPRAELPTQHLARKIEYDAGSLVESDAPWPHSKIFGRELSLVPDALSGRRS